MKARGGFRNVEAGRLVSALLAVAWLAVASSGCCSMARRARMNVGTAPAKPEPVETLAKPTWPVDYDFESGPAYGWKSEWGHVREVEAVTKGENRLLACRWSPSEGFDLTATLGPPRDMSQAKQVCLQIYVPRKLAEAGYGLKIWLDEKWPSGPQAVFTASDADRWKSLCVDVGGIDGVNYDLVSKLGIYLEPGPGARKVDEEVVVYLDNLGLS